MLRDVVAGFLDTVTEREFDAPLIALLAARSFTDVHFLHGPFEFGKDFIAKGPKPRGGDIGTGDPALWVTHQFAIQSKEGDLGLPEWRAVRSQLDEARLDDLAHPAFDREIPRAAVLVTTGRLTGGAPVQAGDYRAAERRHGRPDFEIWDRERLLEWLVDSPEAGLAGTSNGPVLALAWRDRCGPDHVRGARAPGTCLALGSPRQPAGGHRSSCGGHCAPAPGSSRGRGSRQPAPPPRPDRPGRLDRPAVAARRLVLRD